MEKELASAKEEVNDEDEVNHAPSHQNPKHNPRLEEFRQQTPSTMEKELASAKEDIKAESSPYRPTASLSRISSILETICLSSSRVRSAMTLYSTGTSLTQSELIMMPILTMLSTPQQAMVKLVCKSWHRIVSRCLAPAVLTNLTGHKVTPHLLSVVARYQPSSLLLSLTNTSKQL